MLIIELNEFEPNYLKKVARDLNLKNIEKIFKLAHTTTYTNDEKEFQGLDPWVQWVSIHTGKPFKEHSICRLGDTKKQNFKQIWNVFGENKNFSCGIWGVMNGPCGDKRGIKFFVPDPWSFEEFAFPSNLNNFLSLPRYIAKNYLSFNSKKVIKKLFSMIKFIIQNRGNGKTRKFTKMFCKSLLISGLNVHTFYTLLDLLSTLYFIEFKNKFNTNFNIIFLNHLAHLQHQFWNFPSNKISNQMKFGLIIFNEIIGLLIKSLKKNEKFMIINGLSQKIVKGNGIYSYRQKDPISFFKVLGIKSLKTEQNMTNDGILIFNNKCHRDEAINKLKNLYLKSDKSKIFYIQVLDEKRVFFQLDIKVKIKIDEMIISNKKSFKFYDLIECICERTGAHINKGDIFYYGFDFPKKIYNHEIYKLIINSSLII